MKRASRKGQNIVTVRVKAVELRDIVDSRVKHAVAEVEQQMASALKQLGHVKAVARWMMHPHSCYSERVGKRVRRVGCENCDRCIAEADAAVMLGIKRGDER